MPPLPTAPRVPSPPHGFVRFKWTHRRVDKFTTAQVCPRCGAPKGPGDQWGYHHFHGGYQDPVAVEVAARLEQIAGAGSSFNPYHDCERPCAWAVANGVVRPDTTPEFMRQYTCACWLWLRDHWSRWGWVECTVCQCRIWHNFIDTGKRYPGDWDYFYEPLDRAPLVQSPLFTLEAQ